MTTKLTDKDGSLWLDDTLLCHTCNAGDYGLISWPRKDEIPEELAEWTQMLARALFDAREIGLWDGAIIELPDGAEFYPDEELE